MRAVRLRCRNQRHRRGRRGARPPNTDGGLPAARRMNIQIPELCLVLLVGATSSGKSSFARRHFLPTEVISSDYCRALLADDENDQSVTAEAFELLHTIVAKRLKLG